MAAHKDSPRIIPKFRMTKEQKLLYVVIVIQIIILLKEFICH